jgi:proteasome lid subunit RPN8/RPN11
MPRAAVANCCLIAVDESTMAPALSRVEQEELRKRRNNLLRRHNEFWLLYEMKSWLIMESRDGQIFTYHSHPDTPPSSREDMVRRFWLEDGATCR